MEQHHTKTEPIEEESSANRQGLEVAPTVDTVADTLEDHYNPQPMKIVALNINHQTHLERRIKNAKRAILAVLADDEPAIEDEFQVEMLRLALQELNAVV